MDDAGGHHGRPAARGKTSVKLADPSGNVIELKSYDSWSDLTVDGGASPSP